MTSQKVAQILSRLDRKTADRLLAHLEKHESALAREVREEMVLFEDLEKLDDRGMQTLLRELAPDLLATALRGAPKSMVKQCASNLSRTRAMALLETLALSEPIPEQQVEAARKEMIATARDLESRGQLIIPSPAKPVIY